MKKFFQIEFTKNKLKWVNYIKYFFIKIFHNITRNCRLIHYLCQKQKESSFYIPGVRMRLHYGSAHGLQGQLDHTDSKNTGKIPRQSSFCNLIQNPKKKNDEQQHSRDKKGFSLISILKIMSYSVVNLNCCTTCVLKNFKKA